MKISMFCVLMLLVLPIAAKAQTSWPRFEFQHGGYSLELPDAIGSVYETPARGENPGCFKQHHQLRWNWVEPSTMKRRLPDLPTLRAEEYVGGVQPQWRGHERELAASTPPSSRLVGLRWERGDAKAFELHNNLMDWLYVFSTWNVFRLYVEYEDPAVRASIKERFFNSFNLLPCESS